MKTEVHSPANLTDDQLLVQVKALAASERDATATLIASLAELDARRLYLGEGYSSLFAYCTQCLRLSEHAAYGRIEAARAARKFPVILEYLADGSINLTTVCLLARHLATENHKQILEAAQHKNKREVEQQVAALSPRPDVPPTVRRLPAPKTVARGSTAPTVARAGPATEAAPPVVESTRPFVSQPAVVAALAAERYKVQFTVGRDTHDKLRKVQDLLRHSVRDGDLAIIFDRAVTLLLADLEGKKLAKTDRPRKLTASSPRTSPTPPSRHVPAEVKREVWRRDGGQCAFVGADGRCTERGFLEFHHVVPFADSGPSTAANLQLRCRAHNAYEAERWFGDLPLFVREPGALYQLGPGPS